jgi:uncharacterized protein YecE (DUF72 family)
LLYIGTSGWQYRHWRSTFYPEGVPQHDWLRYYSERFRTVELNNSFYQLPEASSFERWREETPDDFVLAAKMSRYLTHLKRLRDPEGPVSLFMERAKHLGDKLGPVLVQLPPRMKADPGRLAAALDQFPEGVRVAVEFRDDSWFSDQTRGVLEERGAAFCLADSPQRETPAWRTAAWGFVRFHAGTGYPWPCYEEGALQGWAERLAGLWGPEEDVYCYFNNDGNACALRDAIVFARLAAEKGLHPTRVPPETDVRVATE